MNTGLTGEQESKVSFGLSTILADTYTLYLQTQNFHWNVKGPRFHQLHNMFEEHYTEMAIAVDNIAERIRALGIRAPGTFSEFLELTSIEEVTNELSADEMINKLVTDHETISRKSREIVHTSTEFRDEASSELLTSRMTFHEKTAWMLRSLLE